MNVFIGNLKTLTLLTDVLKVGKSEKVVEFKFEIDESSELTDLKLFIVNENFYGLDQEISLGS